MLSYWERPTTHRKLSKVTRIPSQSAENVQTRLALVFRTDFKRLWDVHSHLVTLESLPPIPNVFVSMVGFRLSCETLQDGLEILCCFLIVTPIMKKGRDCCYSIRSSLFSVVLLNKGANE